MTQNLTMFHLSDQAQLMEEVMRYRAFWEIKI